MDELIGRYQVVRQLGHGAMARVYLARDPSLERLVALKLLHEHAAQDDARRRFRDEAKALAALNHPGIVGIYEIGTHEDKDFIAMEYLPGTSLREVLVTGDRVARHDELLAICAKVAVAVAAAHRAGILHRDIKPENVVVTDAGAVKVVDFGIARRLNEVTAPRQQFHRAATPIEQVEDVIDAFMATVPVTRTDRDTVASGFHKTLSAGGQTVFGTPGYMAPEVLTGRESSEASDVYSLGVMLYECLAGRRPFDAPSLGEVMTMVIDETVAPKPLDDAQWSLLARMLSRDPVHRPGLDDVAVALAPAPPPPPRARRWPAVVIAAGALAIGAFGAWRVSGASTSEGPGAKASRPLVQATIVIEPIDNEIPSYGAMAPTKRAISDVLAALLRNTRGVTLDSHGAAELIHELGKPAPSASAEPELTAAEMTAHETELHAYVVRGSIVPRDAKLYAHLVLTKPDGTVAADLERERPVAELARLMDDLAEGIARTIDPRAAIDHSKVLAASFAATGRARLADNEFYDARPFLEQAVDADPGSFEAWYALASVRSWMQAPERDVKEATDKALALATGAVQKRLLQGVSFALDGAYREALAQLSPLEAESHLTNTESRDLLYYLGEAHFHLGHQAQGISYFRRALERDPKFKPAMIHPLYYALGRRDGVAAAEMGALMASLDRSSIEFSLGHYAELAGHPNQYQIYARLVLGQPLGPELEAQLGFLDLSILHVAQAIEAGDPKTEQQVLDTFWTRILAERGTAGENTYYMLVILGEVLICGERVDATRRLLGFLAEEARTKTLPGYGRLLLLAAPLLRERAPVDRASLTDRELALADAIDAEMAGDHARAAELLKQLVDDPTPSWNFTERVALLRNLHALHREKEAAVVCAELVKPAIFHYALLTARRHCLRPDEETR